MSTRTARRILWLAAAALVPLPMWILDASRMPALAFLELGAVCVITAVVERIAGSAGAITAVLLGHGVAYLGLLWLAAWLVARALGRLPPRAVARVTIGAVLLGLVVTSTFDVYRNGFGTRASSNLLEVYR